MATIADRRLLVITHLNAGVPAPSETTAQVTSAQVTSIGFHNGLDDWHIEQVGSTAPDQGSVRVGSASSPKVTRSW